MKMNVTDSTESTDTMTFSNNEQSISVLSIIIVYFLKFFTYCPTSSGTKTLDYMEINCSVLNSFS